MERTASTGNDQSLCMDSEDNNDNSNLNDWELINQDQKIKLLDKAGDVLGILQDLNISVKAKQKNNIFIVQNININERKEIESTKIPLIESEEMIIIEATRLVMRKGLRWMIEEIYKKAWELCEFNKSKTARKLGVSIRTMGYRLPQKGDK